VKFSIKRWFPALPGLVGWLLATACTLMPLGGRIFAQQDIPIVGGSNPYIIIGRSITWGGSGFGNLGNNFIFQPVTPDEGFCLFVSNNNPTSSHTFTVVVSQTGDPALTTFTGFAQKWSTVPTTSSFPVTVNASSMVGLNYKTSASAAINVRFSGNTTQAGSPDTADVFAVQTTQSSCGALASNAVQGVYQQGAAITLAQQFPLLIGGLPAPGSTTTVQGLHLGTQGNGILLDGRLCCNIVGGGFQATTNYNAPDFGNSASAQTQGILPSIPAATFGSKGLIGGYTKNNFLEMATDMFSLAAGSMPGWDAEAAIVNPGANTLILADVLGTTAPANVSYKTAVLECSAACEIQVSVITSSGTTCTANTAQNLNLTGGARLAYGTGHSSLKGTCAAQPATTGNPLFDVFLPANTPYTLDLAGFITFHNASFTQGIGFFNVAALTGTATVALTLVEN
jgi:hypothetical protein